ncbi:HAD family hydrolase [Veillonella sp. AS16]|uniref:HAD family hydrolase n=1 Tax=Veillonella sp. AS16 TaxID=936589 RepID=UPI0003E1D601|nr:HAD family hydrolase [Veillonella sp. AS16]ETS93460.1 putative phosphoglycolate phosphatase [Veillonella sp. AS16]
MKYTTIVFDCDGTLLDTLTDLRNAVNHVLRLHKFPERSVSQVKASLGNGVAHLMRESLPDSVTDDEFNTYLDKFKTYYGEHLQDYTAPYPGILDMLDTLRTKGYKLAVVSNKIQEGITPLIKEYFGDRLPVAIGERPGLKRKPAPDMVLQALKELDSTPEESIYIGDSEVDVATANNSGLLCIGVTWGFRDETLHHELGVQYIARKTEDIITIIEELNR